MTINSVYLSACPYSNSRKSTRIATQLIDRKGLIRKGLVKVYSKRVNSKSFRKGCVKIYSKGFRKGCVNIYFKGFWKCLVKIYLKRLCKGLF